MNRIRPNPIAVLIAGFLATVGMIGTVGNWGAYLTDSALEASGPRSEGVVARKHFVSPPTEPPTMSWSIRFRSPLAN